MPAPTYRFVHPGDPVPDGARYIEGRSDGVILVEVKSSAARETAVVRAADVVRYLPGDES